MDVTPKSEIKKRIFSFQEKLREQELDGGIIVLNSDMFYFAGTVQNSYLYIPSTGDSVLMVKKAYDVLKRNLHSKILFP